VLGWILCVHHIGNGYCAALPWRLQKGELPIPLLKRLRLLTRRAGADARIAPVFEEQAQSQQMEGIGARAVFLRMLERVRIYG
jgi:hypothetical protein